MGIFYPRKKGDYHSKKKNSMYSGKGEQGALCAPSDKNVVTVGFALRKWKAEKKRRILKTKDKGNIFHCILHLNC